MDKVRLTALLIAKNGERLLEKCLESIGFCDRIVIIDSGSTDRTPQIAAQFNAVFIEHDWPGFAAQLKWGLDWLAANAPSEWVLSIDCDEVCTSGLKQLIQAAVERPGQVEVFSVQRKTWYYDRYMLHGGLYPDRLFRLFKLGKIEMRTWKGHLQYHPLGPTSALSGDLLHFTYAGFADQLAKINHYTGLGAEYARAKGKPGGLLRACGHASWSFLRGYVFKRGFLDGKAGFVYAAFAAFSVFAKYLRVDEADWGAHVYQTKDFFQSTLND